MGVAVRRDRGHRPAGLAGHRAPAPRRWRHPHPRRYLGAGAAAGRFAPGPPGLGPLRRERRPQPGEGVLLAKWSPVQAARARGAPAPATPDRAARLPVRAGGPGDDPPGWRRPAGPRRGQEHPPGPADPLVPLGHLHATGPCGGRPLARVDGREHPAALSRRPATPRRWWAGSSWSAAASQGRWNPAGRWSWAAPWIQVGRWSWVARWWAGRWTPVRWVVGAWG